MPFENASAGKALNAKRHIPKHTHKMQKKQQTCLQNLLSLEFSSSQKAGWHFIMGNVKQMQQV